MRHSHFTLIACLALLILPAARAAGHVRKSEATPVIPDITPWIGPKGHPKASTWQHAASLSIPYEIQPGHDTPAPVHTRVYIGYTAKSLWLRFVAKDPHPGEIRVKYRDRDNFDNNDDYVGMIFSPFNDSQWAYEFFCSASGIEMDSYRQKNNEYASFNAIWNCHAHRTPDGYVVVMQIPFKSIKFPHIDEPQSWRLVFFRNWARNVRHQIIQFHMNFNNDCILCQSPVFHTATPIQAHGANLQIIPAATLVQSDIRNQPGAPLQHGNPELKGGLDVRWTIRPDLEWSATLNPTFSEVAPDVLQPTFNRRFAIYYPENRPFFMQGTWVFNTPSDFVDTRQIADPHWATKLVGQINANAMGGLIANDSLTNILMPGQQSSSLQSFNFSTQDALLRYRYDTSTNASYGVLATGRKGSGYDNGLFAFDGTWQLDSSDSLTAQVARSTTTYPQQVASAFGIAPGTLTGNDWLVQYSRSRNNYSASLQVNHVDNTFRADLGYLPQVGYTEAKPSFEYDWYSTRDWWNNGGFGGWYDWIDASKGGSILDRKATAYTFVHAVDQSHFIFYMTHEDQYYSGRTFSLNRYELDASAQPLSWLQGEVDVVGGDGVDYTGVRKGGLLSIAPSFTFTPGSHLQTQLVGNFERLNVAGGRLYTARLYDLRVAWYFNARLFARVIAQVQNISRNTALYPPGTSSSSRNLATQWLVGYVLNPFTAFYAGFSNGYLGTGNSGLETQQRTFFLKMSYDFQP
ncbi:MAG: DUF5916 domain-containing protein [Gammaproteobacteria bacterium]